MAESELHKSYIHQLVKKIVTISQKQGEEILIYADLPKLRIGHPRRIGNSVPDVLAVNIGRNIAIIGEAKTLTDVDNIHTYNQIRNYLRYLHENGEQYSELIYAAPWQSLGILDRMIREALREFSGSNIKYSYIHKLADLYG